jgi:hypothetical protein
MAAPGAPPHCFSDTQPLEANMHGPRTFRHILSILSLLMATSAIAQDAAPPQLKLGDLKQSTERPPTPESIAALKEMSTFLSTLKAFQLKSTASLDLVTVNDQRVQIDAVATYKVKRPGAIRLDLESSQKSRSYFYDGKKFTIYSPQLGFYASTAAPPTNREFLKLLYDKYGISLPLEDLFRWSDNDDSDINALTSGFSVGTAVLDGVATDHWAFRQAQYDWEVWIDQGDNPLPLKLVIIDRSDPTHPTYTARLQWTLNPVLADSDFIFTPGKDAKLIQLAEFRGEAK